MRAVFKREFKSYFTNPLGFVILAVLYFFLGFAFKDYYSNGIPYVGHTIFFLSEIGILFFIIPVITMRLFSDERRTKTDQVLFTAPVKLIKIVFGKFFAAFALYAMAFIPTIIFQLIVSAQENIDIPLFHYIYALIGILLFGAALIAVGMFVSSLTESPISAIIFTLITNLIIMFSSSFASFITIPATTNGFLEKIYYGFLRVLVKLLNALDFNSVLNSFGQQTLALKDVVYFISIIIAFIFLTERALEKRRWS